MRVWAARAGGGCAGTEAVAWARHGMAGAGRGGAGGQVASPWYTYGIGPVIADICRRPATHTRATGGGGEGGVCGMAGCPDTAEGRCQAGGGAGVGARSVAGMKWRRGEGVRGLWGAGVLAGAGVVVVCVRVCVCGG